MARAVGDALTKLDYKAIQSNSIKHENSKVQKFSLNISW